MFLCGLNADVINIDKIERLGIICLWKLRRTHVDMKQWRLF